MSSNFLKQVEEQQKAKEQKGKFYYLSFNIWLDVEMTEDAEAEDEGEDETDAVGE